MLLTEEQIRWIGKDLSLYKPLAEPHKGFHRSTAKIKWLFGGNQSSKTYTNMMDLTLEALELHPMRKPVKQGTHWACIESWEQVRDVLWLEYLEKFIPRRQIMNITWGQDKVPKKVHLRNGHTIEFKAFNQGRGLFQSRQIDSAYCDEQCARDFEGIFREIQARLMVRRGFLSWSMTPIIPQPELEERIEELPKTDEVFYFDLNLNRISEGGYIDDQEIDHMIEDWPKEVQATRVAGRFASFFGAVFKSFSRKIHIHPNFKIPDDWEKFRTFDFGFTNPMVCLWVAKDKDENYYVYREYYQERMSILEHLPQIIRLSRGERYTANYADPESPSDRHELAKAGIKTISARKDVARGIEVVQQKLKVKRNGEPSLFFLKRCRNTPREFSAYHYPKGTTANNPRDVPVSKNDHTIDALRYLLYTQLRPRARGKICAA